MNDETLSQALHLLGEKIREERKQRKKTQDEFSLATGIGPKHIGAIENGKKNIQAETILKLRNAGLDVNRILDDVIKALKEEGKNIIEDNQ